MKKFAFLTGVIFLFALLVMPIYAFDDQSFILKGGVVETKIVRGEKIAVELRLFFYPNVIPDLEKLKTEDFGGLKLERIDFSSPTPFNRDYNHLLARLFFEMPKEIGYGEMEIPAIPLEYRITDDSGKILKVERIRSEPLKIEVVSFRIKTKINREAIKIGENLNYIITIVHQADVDIFVEKEKIETDNWKLLNFKLQKRKTVNGKTAKTVVNLLYGYYEVPKNSVSLPGPVIFIRQSHSDKLAEVKLDSKNIKILSILTPQTELREFGGLTVSLTKPPEQWTKNIIFGGTALLFFGGTILLIRSLSAPLTTKIKIQPEKTRRLKKELKKILNQELPPDENEQQNYLIGLYQLIQRYLGSKTGLLKKEALATSAVKFASLANLDRRALLEFEQIIWNKEKLQGEKWMEIKTGLERLIEEGGK